MTAWTDLVQTEFKAGRKKIKSFSLGDAMKSAKKIYKKKKGGDSNSEEKPEVKGGEGEGEVKIEDAPSGVIEGGEGEGEVKVESEGESVIEGGNSKKKGGKRRKTAKKGGKRRKTAKK